MAELEGDLRKVMAPNTAAHLRESKRNVLKDFVHIAGPLGVTHLVILTATHNASYLRVAKSPRVRRCFVIQARQRICLPLSAAAVGGCGACCGDRPCARASREPFLFLRQTLQASHTEGDHRQAKVAEDGDEGGRGGLRAPARAPTSSDPPARLGLHPIRRTPRCSPATVHCGVARQSRQRGAASRGISAGLVLRSVSQPERPAAQAPHCPSVRLPAAAQGPTLAMRVHSYALMRDVAGAQARPRQPVSLWAAPPLLVMNNFGGGGHLKLATVLFQNLFPTLNVATVRLGSCQVRCAAPSASPRFGRGAACGPNAPVNIMRRLPNRLLAQASSGASLPFLQPTNRKRVPPA